MEFREAANSVKGYEALVTGAQVLARTGLRLLTDAALLQEIKDEFAGRSTATQAA